jgi:hypothetical protein
MVLLLVHGIVSGLENGLGLVPFAGPVLEGLLRIVVGS